jgi:hypothetical protein
LPPVLGWRHVYPVRQGRSWRKLARINVLSALQDRVLARLVLSHSPLVSFALKGLTRCLAQAVALRAHQVNRLIDPALHHVRSASAAPRTNLKERSTVQLAENVRLEVALPCQARHRFAIVSTSRTRALQGPRQGRARYLDPSQTV